MNAADRVPETSLSPPPLTEGKEAGAALVLVLSILVLLTALVVAFMMSVKNDLSATVEYSLGQEVNALSDTAVHLVMGQIREATLSGIDSSGKGTHAWASQPGALRVWDDKGDLVQLYKLYSAAKLKEKDVDFLSTEIPSGWRSRPDEYVDLNKPVAKGTDTAGNPKWRYPVLDPAAAGVVDGFSSDQDKTTSGIAWNTAASMPVRWLYVNREGELSDTLKADSVGRLAWWTDDETCKVNINTASATADHPSVINIGGGIAGLANNLGYSFWTTPHSRMQHDYNMGRSAVRQDEFQRYTSHPASVNLLTVLKGPSFSTMTEAQKLNTLRDAFSLFPRYRWGGSENARRLWNDTSATDISGTNQKHERLYASVDELNFATTRNANALPAPAASPTPVPSDPERLDLFRFFLTASSRAPDTNLFGQPRVSLWPVSALDDAQHRTTQDNLIAFCSTVKQLPYYFVRLYPFSQEKDWTEFSRNREIFDYLREMTSRDIPGFGGNYVKKYDQTAGGVAGERDQILTAMFDYIRTVNLNETFKGKPADFVSYTPDVPEIPMGTTNSTDLSNYQAPLKDAGLNGKAGAGMALPILTPFGRGAGRLPVLSEVALFLTQPGTKEPDQSIRPSNTVQSALLFEMFAPMQGFMPWVPRDFQVYAKTDARLNGGEIFPNASSGVLAPVFNSTMGLDRKFFAVGGATGYMMTAPQSGSSSFGRPSNNVIPAPASPLSLSAGNLQVELHMGSLLYQTYSMEIPAAADIPRPLASHLAWFNRGGDSVHFTAYREDVAHSVVPRDGDYRVIAYLQDVPHQFFRKHPLYGTAVSFAHTLRWGPFGGISGVDAGGNRTKGGGSDNGTLVGLPYFKGFDTLGDPDVPSDRLRTCYPDIPPDITDLVVQMNWEGDWDSGLGTLPDGAYLNKPDEGMRRLNNNQNYFNFDLWSPASGMYSPTLMMPSAVMFGSIPTAVRRTYEAYKANNFGDGRPWRTLLFCPNPDFEISGSGALHFGASSPHDFLLADLFNMPVVEPYAISEPLSTAGRINMNYQILPFTKIHRSTALRAVFSGQKVTAMPNSFSLTYKEDSVQNNVTPIFHEIEAAQTLLQFQTRFDAGDLFRSAAEICSIFFIPKGQTFAGIRTWWKDYRLTGDNRREKVYATAYPLLTTKSNTYTVHVIAQSLVRGTNKVTGEYRGSTMIERYIDPADSRLGKETGQTNPDTHSLEPLYRFRVVENKRFAP